jgi:hydroxyacylglutathione hydrolase
MSTPLDSVRWIHGAADCAQTVDPPLQTHQVDEHTFILRQSKCFSYEAPFMYLLFGDRRAVLFDTGAGPDDGDPAKVLPIRDSVEAIIAQWLSGRYIDQIELVVAHTHSHGDHVFWDEQFSDRPNTSVISPGLASVMAFFQLPKWPEGRAGLDLGNRELTILPLPGHFEDHIAIYDPRLGALLTGDTLYPGLLTVRDWPNYRRSAARLAEFAAEKSVSLVLGNHIEMSKRPGELYPLRTTFQPNEHQLPLTLQNLQEWYGVCEAMGNSPRLEVHDHFAIDPL